MVVEPLNLRIASASSSGENRATARAWRSSEYTQLQCQRRKQTSTHNRAYDFSREARTLRSGLHDPMHLALVQSPPALRLVRDAGLEVELSFSPNPLARNTMSRRARDAAAVASEQGHRTI